MDEDLAYEQETSQSEVQTETLQVVDVSALLDGAISGTNARLDGIDEKITQMSDGMRSSADVSTVVIDDQQWSGLVDTMEFSKSASSVSLFLSLLTLCVVSAVLGTRLFGVLADGWRH